MPLFMLANILHFGLVEYSSFVLGEKGFLMFSEIHKLVHVQVFDNVQQ